MRYLISPEYRVRSISGDRSRPARYANRLRLELCARNKIWASDHGHAYEQTVGRLPGLLYREDEFGRHGNFLDETYQSILANRAWNRRLQKGHSTAKHFLLSHDTDRKELDSCHSSDALLMNVFCHPSTFLSGDIQRFLGVSPDVRPEFGYRPKTFLQNGKFDNTEIDMKIDDLLIEAKLTEYDFQKAPFRLVERYESFDQVFDLNVLERYGDKVASYQLIRGVMAVERSDSLRFGVVCDARRPDLINRWDTLLRAVKRYELRCRLVLFTWQELAVLSCPTVSKYLSDKYGILPCDQDERNKYTAD